MWIRLHGQSLPSLTLLGSPNYGVHRRAAPRAGRTDWEGVAVAVAVVVE
jgi:hypothetical protein